MKFNLSFVNRVFVLLLAGLALLPPMAAAQQNMRTIYLVRHAEKISDAADATLSPAGQQRAECLANTLKDAGIKQIFVTDAKRTQQTAEPLAALLKVKPTVIPATDSASLLRSLYYGAPGNVLVVGHSNTLPPLIQRLKAGSIPAIGENDYDRMFIVTVTEGASTPVSTLRFCTCGSAASMEPSPAPTPRRPGTTKGPGSTKKKP